MKKLKLDRIISIATDIAGKDVWVTVSGHLGSQDGYATFEPTEFKVNLVTLSIRERARHIQISILLSFQAAQLAGV